MIYHSILHRTTIVVFYSVKSRARWACKCILLIFLLRPCAFTLLSPCNLKNIALCALAIFSGLLMFAIDGQKFQFILIAAATGLGLVLFSKRDVSISFILFLMSAISVITIAETSLLASAVWSDWIFRRFVIVPSYITEIYYQHFVAADGLTFLGSGMKQVTYLMGEIYFEDPELNLNTNLVFVELAISGLLGLGCAILFLIFG